MAVDKLVDSTQLDADLTSVANAIRTKGGTSAGLAFPAGFVSAVEAIPVGSGATIAEYVMGTVTNYANADVTYVRTNGFAYSTIDSISLPNATTLGEGAFQGSQMTSCYLPKVTGEGNSLFYNAKKLVNLALPSWVGYWIRDGIWRLCSALEKIDFGENTSELGRNNLFTDDAVLTTIVIRANTLVGLRATNCFNGTPFRSGGSGGTIYIPKTMYNHLGDGTELDYKSATNWSTIDGYGTITWAKIEGSQYENYYVDGTPVT